MGYFEAQHQMHNRTMLNFRSTLRRYAHTRTGFLCTALAVFATASVGAMAFRPMPTVTVVPMKTYAFDVQHPMLFLDRYLPQALSPHKPGHLDSQSIEGTAQVDLVNNQKSMSLDTIAIHGVRMGEESFYIRFIGNPRDINGAFKNATQICGVIGISDAKLVSWLMSEQFAKTIGRTCLQVGETADGNEHSVEIRRSLSDDLTRQWAVDYTIYFHE